MRLRELRQKLKAIEFPTPKSILDVICEEIYRDSVARIDGKKETLEALLKRGKRLFKDPSRR